MKYTVYWKTNKEIIGSWKHQEKNEKMKKKHVFSQFYANNTYQACGCSFRILQIYEQIDVCMHLLWILRKCFVSSCEKESMCIIKRNFLAKNIYK